MTSDHTIVRWNQIPDPVIWVWEHTVCVGLGLIRGQFRMAPQPGNAFSINLQQNVASPKTKVEQEKLVAKKRLVQTQTSIRKIFEKQFTR